MTTLLQQRLENDARTQLALALPVAARAITELVRDRAPVESGATRDAVDWRPDGFLEFRVFVDAEEVPQARFTDSGTQAHQIVAGTNTNHGILSDFATGGSFFVGGTAENPAVVNHPGSTKHKGWFTDAPWDTWIRQEMERAMA